MRFTRVTLALIAFIILLGFYQLAWHFVSDVEPQVFQATEEVMVDVANLLAELVEEDVTERHFDLQELRGAFGAVHTRVLEAKIFGHMKRHVGIQAYLTDAKGIVVFDTDSGQREGLDFSDKRDVAKTLAGTYGARSSKDDDLDSATSVLYVAAAIGDSKKPLGVLTVYKAQADVMSLVTERRKIIYTACALIGSGILFLIGAVFLWLFRPIGRITEYANAIERGERPAKPKIGIGREVNTLARALDSMRSVLEGRRYAERYIQTLTHEIKSPLAAIRGAAELLDEEMAPETRRKFLENIRAEAARSERLINRLLELSVIESRSSLDEPQRVDFHSITAHAVDQAQPMAHVAGVKLEMRAGALPVFVSGDPFILRAAITNLLENAIDFSGGESDVIIEVQTTLDRVILTVRDYGMGIPDYAQEKVFERFYSLRHHTSKRKGTGLGLTLVREAAELHGGTINLEPADGGGTVATLNLPKG